MLAAGDREWEDTGWLDWWAALYGDESFIAAHHTQDTASHRARIVPSHRARVVLTHHARIVSGHHGRVAPGHHTQDEPLFVWDEDDYPPTLTRWKRAGAAPWPTLTTWPGWPLPQLGVPHMCQ